MWQAVSIVSAAMVSGKVSAETKVSEAGYRCHFWPSMTERLAIAMAIQARMEGRHGGDRRTDQGGNISTLTEQGKSRDIAAAKAGLGSGKTLEAAKTVLDHGAPELIAAMAIRVPMM